MHDKWLAFVYILKMDHPGLLLRVKVGWDRRPSRMTLKIFGLGNQNDGVTRNCMREVCGWSR